MRGDLELIWFWVCLMGTRQVKLAHMGKIAPSLHTECTIQSLCSKLMNICRTFSALFFFGHKLISCFFCHVTVVIYVDLILYKY